MSEQIDRQDVQDCLGGDCRAFERIVDRYQKPVYNAAFRIVGNEDDAADIAQTVFVKAFENLASFNPKFKFFSWIYRMAVNESINCLARRKNQTELDDQLRSTDKTPEEEFEDTRLGEKIQSALVEIQLDYRIVLILRHFMDLTYQEMSEILKVPEKRVKSRLFSARKILCDILSHRGIGVQNG